MASGHRGGRPERPAGILGGGRKVAADHRDPAAKETDLLKQATKQANPGAAATADRSTELWAFFRGELVPLREANVNVMTHGFNYGTAVFEGIRAYWNAEQKQLYALDLLPHYERIQPLRPAPSTWRSRTAPRSWPTSPSSSSGATDSARTSTSARSSTSRASSSASGSTTSTADFTIFAIPFGKYIDTESAASAPR